MAIVPVCVLLFSGCASIFTRSTYPVSFSSVPDEANVTILDVRSNQTIFAGKTPAQVRLDASHKYMKGARYNVIFNKPGYEEYTYVITSNLDGWYFGNILLGGLIGMLIVDPATGAMYRIKDKNVGVRLTPTGETVANNYGDGLTIVDINNLSEVEQLNLEQIN